MASTKSLEDMLSSDYDESVVSALVGSLESQLSSSTIQPSSLDINPASINTNHASEGNLRDGALSRTAHKLELINNIDRTTIGNIPQKILPANSTNQIVDLSSVSTSNNTITSGVMVSGGLPASGYISQVASVGSSTPSLQTNAALSGRHANNSDIKIVYSSQNSSNQFNNAVSCNTSMQQRNVLPNGTVGTVTIPSTTQLVTITSSASIQNPSSLSMSSIQNLATVASQQPHIMISTPQQTTLQSQLSSGIQIHSNSSNSDPINVHHDIETKPSPNVLQGASTASSVITKPGSTQPLNVVTQVVSNPNLLHNVQILNMNNRLATPFGQKIAPRIVLGNSSMRIAPNSQILSARPGTPVQNALNIPNLIRNNATIFVKTENGQLQVLNMAPPSSTANTTTYRIQPGTTTSMRPLAPQHLVVTSQTTTTTAKPLTIQTSSTTPSTNDGASTPSQMSPTTAKKKCKNFLSTLIQLAKDQPDHVAANVKNLVQGIIDGAIQPEEFATQLHKELNSSPQPCLVPFLKKSLPYLRHSLMTKELSIDGVVPPPPGSVTLPPMGAPASLPQQIQMAAPPGGQTTLVQSGNQLRLLTPTGSTLAAQLAAPGLLTSHRLATTTRLPITPKVVTLPIVTPKPPPLAAKTSKIHSPMRGIVSSSSSSSYSGGLRVEEDDLNDVAAMGGVNLVEESRAILAADLVGTHVRSCKDALFLATQPLQARLNAAAKEHGLGEVPSDVTALVSHATQEYLKSFLERLAILAEHRLENIKLDHRFEVSQDVKAQLKYLEELDKLEKKRHEEHEREVLMRAAKSRSKLDDPEQVKMKQKAKDLQRAELEEMRHREANATALLAIGPRKKVRLDTTTLGAGGAGLTTQIRPRVKRVNLRDLIFLLEQDKNTSKSQILYKSYLK